MPFTQQDELPTYEELTVPELEITSSVFRTAAHHLGKYCDKPSKEFMLCRLETEDPRKCLAEGKEVTKCAFEFLGMVKKSCLAEFNQYLSCIDHSDQTMEFKYCRNTQAVYDKCIKDNFGQDRPENGYFSKVRVHETDKTWPGEQPHILPEAPAEPPDTIPRTIWDFTTKPPQQDKFKNPNLLYK